ncbi:hypothetical protein TNCV_2163721 [Trichonephila clavipes]|nr:hypothetical protein TNCV_2163721 [Trichonephila clavipes]
MTRLKNQETMIEGYQKFLATFNKGKDEHGVYKQLQESPNETIEARDSLVGNPVNKKQQKNKSNNNIWSEKAKARVQKPRQQQPQTYASAVAQNTINKNNTSEFDHATNDDTVENYDCFPTTK